MWRCFVKLASMFFMHCCRVLTWDTESGWICEHKWCQSQNEKYIIDTFPHKSFKCAKSWYSHELMGYMEVLKCSHGLYGMYDILKLQMRRLNLIKFCHVIFLFSPKFWIPIWSSLVMGYDFAKPQLNRSMVHFQQWRRIHGWDIWEIALCKLNLLAMANVHVFQSVSQGRNQSFKRPFRLSDLRLQIWAIESILVHSFSCSFWPTT